MNGGVVFLGCQTMKTWRLIVWSKSCSFSFTAFSQQPKGAFGLLGSFLMAALECPSNVIFLGSSCDIIDFVVV